MKNAVHWVEIPVKDIEKATKFYEQVLGTEMKIIDAMGMRTAFLPVDMETGGVGGCLMEGPGYEPSAHGSLVYLNGGEDLSEPLSKVQAAGGEILLPKTSLGKNGFMAHFTDTEGNRIGLYSAK